MLRLLLLGALVGWSFGQGAQLDERRIGPEGGALRIPGIQVWVPPGALHTPVRFRLERLQAVPTSPPRMRSSSSKPFPTGKW